MSDTLDDKSKTLVEKHHQHDLLTRDECQLILDKILNEDNERGSLVSYEIVPELESVGYLGEYFNLYIKYQKPNESNTTQRRLFVKTKPYQNQYMADLMEKSGILKKESTLYTKLLNEIRIFSPKIWCAQCYLVKPDLFVMQNILDLGYEPIKDVSKFLKKQEIESILKGLAVMHASSLAFEEKNDVKIGDMLKDVLFEATVSPDVVWYKAGIKAVIAVAHIHPAYFLSQIIQSIIQNELPSTFDSIYEMVNPSTKYCNVFCHRDIWAANVFFSKTNPTEKCAVFVDFQLCRYSPAAIDVLMTLFLNVRPRERKLIEQDCYEFYYKQFSEELSSMGLNADNFITHDQFLQSIKELKLFGALYNCIAATILRVPDDYLKDMKLNRPEDFYHYTNVDRTKELLVILKSHPEFKDYMFECIDDMMFVLLALQN